MKAVLAILALGLIGAGQAPEAPAGEQFDLHCTGETVIDRTLRRPYDGRIHLDLSAGLWCIDECPAAQRIADITPTTITLEESGVSARRVDRVAATYTWVDTSAGVILRAETTCRMEPFTPFPRAQF